MSGGSYLEVEVKFRIFDLDEIHARLASVGAEQTKPRLHERNVRYDDDRATLLHRGQLLRLRQDDKARLTFKGMAAADAHSEAKVREELETTVDNFQIAEEILARLGFHPQQVYEKYRTTYRLGNVEIVVDELPFGNFVELEGDEDAIRETAQRLALSWENRILHNYLLLMARVKERYALPFDDLTFENFQDIDVSLGDVLGRG